MRSNSSQARTDGILFCVKKMLVEPTRRLGVAHGRLSPIEFGATGAIKKHDSYRLETEACA